MWSQRTANADWATRTGHTSVIDATGAIYVLGGSSGISKNDVWRGTAGGEARHATGASSVMIGWQSDCGASGRSKRYR
jgi:hypothetical protein